MGESGCNSEEVGRLIRSEKGVEEGGTHCCTSCSRQAFAIQLKEKASGLEKNRWRKAWKEGGLRREKPRGRAITSLALFGGNRKVVTDRIEEKD